MCKVISIINQKGGVSKTTTTLNMAYELSQIGKRVLVIDYDPQGNLSMCKNMDYPDQMPITIGAIMQRKVLGEDEGEQS